MRKRYKKSARVVGDVIGKYHPHGEAAVYDAIVRMAQDFSLRYPLIDGQGNFGSIDGDPPAAMRYTEVRMSRHRGGDAAATSRRKRSTSPPTTTGRSRSRWSCRRRSRTCWSTAPTGLPSAWRPRSRRTISCELIDGLLHIIRDPGCTFAELMEHIKGPDFPTAGIICGSEGIRSAYSTGRGSIIMRARAHVEEAGKKGFERIVVTEIPYQVNKTRLIEQIADLVRSKKLEGIGDIRDESDREGMRIVLDLKRDETCAADPEPPLQAHPDAGDLRRDPAGDRRATSRRC